MVKKLITKALVIFLTTIISSQAFAQVKDSTLIASIPDTLKKDQEVNLLHLNHLDTINLNNPLYAATQKYDFINYNINFIQQPNHEALEKFYTALGKSKTRKINIVHIGDSHVQPDGYSYNTRNLLQKEFGDAGRGMIFPYRAGGTHNAYTHACTIEGKWEHARNLQGNAPYNLGMTGVTAHTEDVKASFKMSFRHDLSPSNFDLVKLYYKRSAQTFNLRVLINDSATVFVNCVADTSSTQPYLTFRIPKTKVRTMAFFMEKATKKVNDSTEVLTSKFFELYGLSLELENQNGILYHAVGINGAPFAAILRQNLMEAQIKEINPDLVILDMGGNEYYGRGVNKETYKNGLIQIIKNIKLWCPNASIILSSPHEFYYRKYYNRGWGKDARDVTREVAFDNNCGFWDNYAISGGRYAVPKWQNEGLFGYDRIHLTAAGYGLRGALFTQGLLTSYNIYQKGPECYYSLKDSFAKALARVESVKETPPKDAYAKAYTVNTNGKNQTVYVVQNGDNLGLIARRFGTTVTALQTWNGMNGTFLKVGQKLVVYAAQPSEKPQVATVVTPKQPNIVTPKQPNGNTPVIADKTNTSNIAAKGIPKFSQTHTVNKGDNLWSIAKRYGTTIDKLCSLNNITTKTMLNIGMRLIIR